MERDVEGRRNPVHKIKDKADIEPDQQKPSQVAIRRYPVAVGPFLAGRNNLKSRNGVYTEVIYDLPHPLPENMIPPEIRQRWRPGCRVLARNRLLYPSIPLGPPEQSVRNSRDAQLEPNPRCDESLMCVDSYEDDWMRLTDIRLNDNQLEYSGRGKTIVDVGLAQARRPLDTRCHYFEIEIVDPGASCYIAIGLTKKEYPSQSHPGWYKGSIAYHADDGKLFMGSGNGTPFGPKCSKGDIMGCGIIFPTDDKEAQSPRKPRAQSLPGAVRLPPPSAAHLAVPLAIRDPEQPLMVDHSSGSEEPTPSEFSSDSEACSDQEIGAHPHRHQDPDHSSLFDSDEDSDGYYEPFHDANHWSMRPDDYRLLAIGRGFPVQFLQERRGRRRQEDKESGPKVEVFFTRNGVMIGKKEIAIPKGGFYPTVGMLSSNEKVKVDLHPLSG